MENEQDRSHGLICRPAVHVAYRESLGTAPQASTSAPASAVTILQARLKSLTSAILFLRQTGGCAAPTVCLPFQATRARHKSALSRHCPTFSQGNFALQERQELRGADGATCCFTVTLVRPTVTFDDASLLKVSMLLAASEPLAWRRSSSDTQAACARGGTHRVLLLRPDLLSTPAQDIPSSVSASSSRTVQWTCVLPCRLRKATRREQNN